MTQPGPRFIVFEGGEGAGKSTIAAALADRLRAEGREVVLTREPGGTAAGEKVRALLHEPLTPWAEAFAFLAARAQIVDEVIRPALERGATVLCDRFSASTLAYQGYARGLDLDTLRLANAAATGGLEPDLVIWLDVEPEDGLARKLGEGEGEVVMTGLENVDFHKKVRLAYADLMAEAPPGAWVRIDASQPPAVVEEEAWAAIAASKR